MKPPGSFAGRRGDTYSIGERIHRSQFSTVYSAVKNGSIDVAIKELRNGKAEGDPEEWYSEGRLLEREWEISESLRGRSHDHLLLIDDRFTESDFDYHVMPLAEKVLTALMGRLTDDETLKVVRELALGMQELKDADVLHRDIKPSNVLFWNGTWRLADFGISKIEGHSNTVTWMGTGTLDYKAPELFYGNSESMLTDMYSLGCLVYALRMGRPPFAGASNLRRDHETVVPEMDGTIGPVLGRLIHRLIAKNPQGRPQSPDEVLRLCGAIKSPLQEKFLQVELAYARQAAENDAIKSRRQRIANLYSDAVARLEHVVEGAYGDLTEMSVEVSFGKDADSLTWFLRLQRHQLNVKLAAQPEWDRDHDIVCFAVLTILKEGDFNADRPVANLVCEETEGSEGLSWSIVRFSQESTQARIGLAWDDGFLRAYPNGWDANKIVLEERTGLTADSLLELFVAVLQRELEVADVEPAQSAPSRSSGDGGSESAASAEIFEMFEPDLSKSSSSIDFESRVGELLTSFSVGEMVRDRPSQMLDYLIRASDGRQVAVDVRYKKIGELQRKDLVKAVVAANEFRRLKVVVVTNAPLSEEVRKVNSVGSLEGIEIEAVTLNGKHDTAVFHRVVLRSFR